MGTSEAIRLILIVIKLILINLIYKPFISFISLNKVYIVLCYVLDSTYIIAAPTIFNIVNIMNSVPLCEDVLYLFVTTLLSIPASNSPNNGNNKSKSDSAQEETKFSQ